MVRVFSGTHRVTLTDVDVPILCIPIDAKYKKTETIGFTTRTLDQIKKALKKE
jgi:UDP-N-acetyl-D-mannosaminuronate dehydrogenase